MSELIKTTETERFSVDVGTSTPFEVTIDGAVRFIRMGDGECKLCVRVEYERGKSPEVVVLKWSAVQRDCNTRNHITSQIGATVTITPSYRLKEVFNHEGTFVSIGIRNYIPGRTFKSVMERMNRSSIDAVQLQVEAISWELAKKTSTHFGHIQDGSLRTENASSYIRTRAFLDKLRYKLDADSWNEIGSDNHIGKAVFCHGALTPDHIILDGDTVVALIGWSNADFVPEAYDRLKYYFESSPQDPYCWYRKMANVPSTELTPPPSVEFVINTSTYMYKSAWQEADGYRRRAIDSLWKALRTNYTLVTCLSTAMEVESDTMSLASLSNWTESTWDKSVVPPLFS